MLGISVSEPKCCVVEVKSFEPLRVFFDLIAKRSSIRLLKVAEFLRVKMVGLFGELKPKQSSTLLVCRHRRVLYYLQIDFLDQVARALKQAREVFHVRKRASKAVVATLRPLVHALHIHLSQDVLIDGAACLKRGISRGQRHFEMRVSVLAVFK